MSDRAEQTESEVKPGRMFAEYANDLREIIQRLRGKMN